MNRETTQIINAILALHCAQKGLKISNLKTEIGKTLPNESYQKIVQAYSDPVAKIVYDKLLKTLEDNHIFGIKNMRAVPNPKYNQEKNNNIILKTEKELGYFYTEDEYEEKFGKSPKEYSYKSKYNDDGRPCQYWDDKNFVKTVVKNGYEYQYIVGDNNYWGIIHVRNNYSSPQSNLDASKYVKIPSGKYSIEFVESYDYQDPASSITSYVSTEHYNAVNEINALFKTGKIKSAMESSADLISKGIINIRPTDAYGACRKSSLLSLIYESCEHVCRDKFGSTNGNDGVVGFNSELEEIYFTFEQCKHIIKTYEKEVIAYVTRWSNGLYDKECHTEMFYDSINQTEESFKTLMQKYTSSSYPRSVNFDEKTNQMYIDLQGLGAIKFYIDHKDWINDNANDLSVITLKFNNNKTIYDSAIEKFNSVAK